MNPTPTKIHSVGSVRAGALTAQNYSLTFNDFVVTFGEIKDRSFGIAHKKQSFFLKRALPSNCKVRKRLLPVPCSTRLRGGSLIGFTLQLPMMICAPFCLGARVRSEGAL